MSWCLELCGPVMMFFLIFFSIVNPLGVVSWCLELSKPLGCFYFLFGLCTPFGCFYFCVCMFSYPLGPFLLVLEALIMFRVLGFPIGVLLICICKDPKITRGICLGWEFYICKKWCFFCNGFEVSLQRVCILMIDFPIIFQS